MSMINVNDDINSRKSRLPVFHIENPVVKINGTTQAGVNGFYANIGDDIEVTMDVTDGDGNIIVSLDQSALQIPGLKLPIIKLIDGINSAILDKVYFNTTLIEGVVTITGSFVNGGDWKLTEDKTNLSLEAIGAPFRITRNPLTFVV